MKKLLMLTALIASTFAAIPAPSAQAIATCGTNYCTGRPSSSTCACPSGTDYPGDTVTCGSWPRLCYKWIDPPCCQ